LRSACVKIFGIFKEPNWIWHAGIAVGQNFFPNLIIGNKVTFMLPNYMALSRKFRTTVKARADRDPGFRIGLFQEAMNAFMDSDVETGKIVLRDYGNVTVGFERLGKELDKNPKNLMRMLSAKGNPRTDNLFAVLAHLKAQENVSLRFEAAE
jgi:hypothetical protein